MRVRLFHPETTVNRLITNDDGSFGGFRTEVVQPRRALPGVHTLEGAPGALTLTTVSGTHGTLEFQGLTLGLGTDYLGRIVPQLYRVGEYMVAVDNRLEAFRGAAIKDVPVAIAPWLDPPLTAE